MNWILAQKILNKTLIFDTSTIDEEIIMDRVIDALNGRTNDDFYIEHPAGWNHFTLRRENERKKILKEAKTIFSSLKLSLGVFYSQRKKLTKDSWKNWKNQNMKKTFCW